MKIGVFDSGIGGKAVADTLKNDFPEAEILYVHDSKHVPYGGRKEQQIIQLTDAAIQPLIAAACDVIVIACNTATAAAIEFLRDKYEQQKFIGLEPMVKPASEQTESGVIAIFATPFTLQSARYTALKATYAQNITVIEPDCSDWASMIERDELDEAEIAKEVAEALDLNADILVLACTHYHWIKELILELSKGKARVIDPSEAISRRVASLLSL